MDFLDDDGYEVDDESLSFLFALLILLLCFLLLLFSGEEEHPTDNREVAGSIPHHYLTNEEVLWYKVN